MNAWIATPAGAIEMTWRVSRLFTGLQSKLFCFQSWGQFLFASSQCSTALILNGCKCSLLLLSSPTTHRRFILRARLHRRNTVQKILKTRSHVGDHHCNRLAGPDFPLVLATIPDTRLQLGQQHRLHSRPRHPLLHPARHDRALRSLAEAPAHPEAGVSVPAFCSGGRRRPTGVVGRGCRPEGCWDRILRTGYGEVARNGDDSGGYSG